MGSWGAGIFENDIAAMVRNRFEETLEEGAEGVSVTQLVIKQLIGHFENEFDGPAAYLALAALQLEHGALESDTKERALRIIATDQMAESAEEAGFATLSERRKHVLNELQTRLLRFDTTSPPTHTTRSSQLKQKASKIAVQEGDIIVVTLGRGMLAAGIALCISKRFKNTILIGIYDHLFKSTEELDISALGGSFAITPNYYSLAPITDGEWTIAGHSSRLLALAKFPELEVAYGLYYKDHYIRKLSPEEYGKYPMLTVSGGGALELRLKRHFLNR